MYFFGKITIPSHFYDFVEKMFSYKRIYHFVIKMWWKCNFAKLFNRWRHRFISFAACRFDEACHFEAASETSPNAAPRHQQIIIIRYVHFQFRGMADVSVVDAP